MNLWVKYLPVLVLRKWDVKLHHQCQSEISKTWAIIEGSKEYWPILSTNWNQGTERKNRPVRLNLTLVPQNGCLLSRSGSVQIGFLKHQVHGPALRRMDRPCASTGVTVFFLTFIWHRWKWVDVNLQAMNISTQWGNVSWVGELIWQNGWCEPSIQEKQMPSAGKSSCRMTSAFKSWKQDF